MRWANRSSKSVRWGKAFLHLQTTKLTTSAVMNSMGSNGSIISARFVISASLTSSEFLPYDLFSASTTGFALFLMLFTKWKNNKRCLSPIRRAEPRCERRAQNQPSNAPVVWKLSRPVLLPSVQWDQGGVHTLFGSSPGLNNTEAGMILHFEEGRETYKAP